MTGTLQRMGVAIFALAAMAIWSTAEAASTTRAVNMRSGPGTGYSVITTVPGGVPITIYGCAGGWCQAAYGRWSGYVSAAYIANASGPGTTNLRTSTGGTVTLSGRSSPPALGLILQGGGVRKKRQQLNNRASPSNEGPPTFYGREFLK
jgi:uncharacterized protein YraI